MTQIFVTYLPGKLDNTFDSFLPFDRYSGVLSQKCSSLQQSACHGFALVTCISAGYLTARVQAQTKYFNRQGGNSHQFDNPDCLRMASEMVDHYGVEDTSLPLGLATRVLSLLLMQDDRKLDTYML